MPVMRVAHKAFFWVVIGIGFLVYIVGIFNNINSIRKIHGAYIRGFYFQKECDDEYTEYESLRRHTYLAIKGERTALDAGAYMNLVLLFWVPVAALLLITGHMVGISLLWTGILAILLGVLVYVLSNQLIDPKARERFYQFFEGSYCGVEPITSLTVQRRFQTFVAIVSVTIVYAYYALHSTYNKGTETVFLNKFPNILNSTVLKKIRDGDETKMPFGYLLYKYAGKYNYAFYALFVLWVFAFLWVYLTSKQHQRLRDRVLCHYEGLMDEYAFTLESYIYPDPAPEQSQEAYDRETAKRFTDIKDRIERAYFRIHETMPVPNITEDNIGEYAIYLMNWRGREFETLPESPELNKLRDFMYRLRTEKIYRGTVEDYLKFSKRYLLIHFVFILYIAFHVLYQFETIRRSLILVIGIGIIMGLFVLSWYAWFDVALRV